MTTTSLLRDIVRVPCTELPEGSSFGAYAEQLGVRRVLVADTEVWQLPWRAVLAGADWTGEAFATSEDSEADVAREADLEMLSWLAGYLHLPPVTTLTLYVKTRGTFGRPDALQFATSWEVERLPVGSLDTLGPIIRDEYGSPRKRMTSAQWTVLEILGEQRGRMSEDELRRLAARAKAAADTSIRLDNYLVNEDVVELDSVAPSLVPLADGSGYRLEAQAASVERADLTRYMQGGAGGIRVPLGGRGRRTVLVSERAKRGLEALRDKKVVRDDELPRLLTDPEAFFGPDLDTSAFTNRVVGVGVVTSGPQAFNSALQIGGWFEFAERADAPYGEAGLDLASPERRDAVCAAIRAAERDGVAWFKNPFGDGYLQITAALKAAVCPVPEVAKPERRGLMVKTNEAELEVDSEHELQFVGKLTPLPELPLRRGLELKPHQAQCVRWLLTLAAGRDQGALLADDMGLGKTLQVLALLAALKGQGRDGPHLVVAPVGLLTNWEREAQRFFGDLFEDIVIIQGRARYTNAELEGHRLVLVGYDSLRLNEFLFARVRWDVVVLDEAQRIKNPKIQVARVVRALHARFRLASTGTPVENSLDELWAIFDWVMPGLLGTLQAFSRTYVEPARAAAQLGEWGEAAALSVQLRQQLGRYFMRRTKEEVLTLEPLTIVALPVAMSAAQRERYSTILGQRRNGLSALSALHQLFDVCAHPELGVQTEPRLPIGLSYPKADALWRILDGVRAAGERAIVFAKRIPIQDWLADEIASRYGRRPAIINGEISSSAERMRIVERFQQSEEFRVLVLSPRAAGVGLTITAANHVIHFTREWNPAVENQATDRAYRFGQTRPVSVYHVIVRGGDDGRTVEERLDDLLERKRGLMREFVVPMVPVTVEEADFGL